MQALHCVRSVDHLANLRREGEQRHDVFPGPPPARRDRRIAWTPFGLELVESGGRRHGRLGAIDRPQIGNDLLAVLPRHERQRVADQVDNAGLHRRLWEAGRDRLGEALEPVDDRDQDVGDPAGLQFVHHLEPELGALGLFSGIQLPTNESALGFICRNHTTRAKLRPVNRVGSPQWLGSGSA